jgi:capsular polysaccharide transport system permease protein
MRSLIIQFRVIFALILREARVRHGRSRAGYLWTIVEPVLLIGALTFLFANVRSVGVSGAEFAVFFATGVLPFQLFRNSSQYISLSFEANAPLLNYPYVKKIDTVIARAVLDFCTHIFVITLVLSFQIYVINAPFPADIPMMLFIIVILMAFAIGAGLCVALMRQAFPSFANIYLILMGPSFFISGVFFSLSSLPVFFREILIWNPIIHGVEGFRSAYYQGYRSADLDLSYLFWWAFSLIFIGLLAERTMKKIAP